MTGSKKMISILNASPRKKHAIVPGTAPGFRNRGERNWAEVAKPFMRTIKGPNFHPSDKNEPNEALPRISNRSITKLQQMTELGERNYSFLMELRNLRTDALYLTFRFRYT